MRGGDGIISLCRGGSICTVAPTIGGSIAGWSVDGQPMLRSADEGTGDPRGMASFPLLPYSNRIAAGRFHWNGQTFALPQTWPEEALPLHGIGMLRQWRVAAVEADRVVMRLSHAGDPSWPFAFGAEQRIAIAEDALHIAMRIVNRADHPAPAAFGHHPYFDSKGASLRFVAENVWQNDSDMLPVAAHPPAGPYDFSEGAAVAGKAIDNGYTGWGGSATIAWQDRPYRLSIAASASLPVAVVYIPEGGSHFCFEPVPHLTDAINRPDCPAPMPILAAGATFESGIRMQALPASA